MRPLMLLAALPLLLAPSAALAQASSGPRLNLNHIRFDATGTGLAVTSSPSTLGLLQGSGGISLNLADRPVVLYDGRGASPTAWGTIVQSTFALDLHGAIGFGFLDVGLNLPVAPAIVWGTDPTRGDFPVGTDDEGAVGDLVVTPKIRILDARDKGFGFGVQIPVGLPTGMADKYFGDGGVSVSVDLLMEVNIKDRFRFLANVSPIHLRPQVTYGTFERLAGMKWAAGVEVAPADVIGIRAEAWGSASYVGSSSIATAEWSASVALHPSAEVSLELGAGSGIVGVGVPRIRAFAGVRVTSAPQRDSDGDGIKDSKDECKTEPEDFDNWMDFDGCPDPDNDSDGIPDALDACPDDAENPGVGVDDDGCPDPVGTPPAVKAAPAPDEAAPASDGAAPASDEAAPPSDEAAPPSDEAAPPSDEAAPPSDEAAPPSDEAVPTAPDDAPAPESAGPGGE